MSPSRSDFATYFAAMHDGQPPFRWQESLLDQVLKQGRWPRRVVAPTGSGKTAVIDIHVFAQALTVDAGPRPPRRLAMVVDRRVLVDDQYRYARQLANRLVDPDEPVLAAIAERLWRLHPSDPNHPVGRRNDVDSPLVLGRLRGGIPPSRRWREHPSAAAIICATPDMWGSRLLFRGYGSSSLAWPREAGLLAFDSVVVVDEAHLARQLLRTARRVGELASVADRPLPVAPLQVVETTATPADTEWDNSSIGVQDDDLEDDRLARRLTRPKPLTLLPVKDWHSPNSARPVKALAEAVITVRAAADDDTDASRTVGCFVNTVARAIAVADELRDKHGLRVVMICGQARPIDIDRLELTYPGLLTPAGNNRVDVLVCTQSLEVGVDLDLAAMVTELASGSALAQRAGRVNRRGARHTGPITVTVPDGEITDNVRSGPYSAEDLRQAADWLRRRAADSAGVSPWALRAHPPPAPAPRRILDQRPELGHAWHWARTSDDLAAEPELELWLSDDLADDTSVGVVVRHQLPADPTDAAELVRQLPPRPHEVFAVPYRTARDALAVMRSSHSDGDRGPNDPTTVPAIVVRDQDYEPLQWRPPEEPGGAPSPKIRPGDTIVLDAAVALFTRSNDASPPVVMPDGQGTPHPAEDRLAAEALLPTWKRERERGGVVLRIERTPPELAELLTDQNSTTAHRAVRAWLTGLEQPTDMHRSALKLLDGRVSDSDVIVQADDDGPRRVLVLDRRRAAADETIRQVWTPRPDKADPVELADHQRSVAERAAQLGQSVELTDDLVDILRTAGRHHDDGKQDERFQRRLGGNGERLLAKSPPGTTVKQTRDHHGLPAGWRHEQRSVIDCWQAVSTCPDPQLAARLVGTSHGHGRSGFPRSGRDLVADNALARELFDHGEWDELIERTHQRYGVWGCAYLEALLRGADGQVSGEGR